MTKAQKSLLYLGQYLQVTIWRSGVQAHKGDVRHSFVIKSWLISMIIMNPLQQKNYVRFEVFLRSYIVKQFPLSFN